MAQKLWRVSRILNKNPFEESVISLSVPQMDWIMAMYAIDNPKEFKFTPASEVGKESLSMDLNIAWADKLIGEARKQFMAKMSPKRKGTVKPVGRQEPGIRSFVQRRNNGHAKH